MNSKWNGKKKQIFGQISFCTLELMEGCKLSHTPKKHSLIMNALQQMIMYGGIGDILEDNVMKMHQIAG
jgi:hypothetical protein